MWVRLSPIYSILTPFIFSCHPILILNCPLSLKVDIMRMAHILKYEAQPLQSSFKFDKFSTILPNGKENVPILQKHGKS